MVTSALGFSTYAGSVAIATDAVTGALLTYTQSGKPGEIILFWGTGLGADPADGDTTYTPAPHQLNANLQLYIGGIKADIIYQGASVYPGVTVLGVTIPPTVGTGCFRVGGGFDRQNAEQRRYASDCERRGCMPRFLTPVSMASRLIRPR